MAHQPNHNNQPAGHHHDHETPASGVLFFVKVDDQSIEFDHRHVTGRDLLTAANKTPPDHFDLYEKSKDGGRKLIGLDDKVDLLGEGIEKFRTIPKKRTDGRDRSAVYPLTEEDEKFLDASGYTWAVESWQGNRLVTIRGYKLPCGYNCEMADVAFVVPLTYPAAQIDMFYILPGVSRSDGRPLHAVTIQLVNGQTAQQWSRHRTPESAWRVGIDNLETQVGLMDACLRDELER